MRQIGILFAALAIFGVLYFFSGREVASIPREERLDMFEAEMRRRGFDEKQAAVLRQAREHGRPDSSFDRLDLLTPSERAEFYRIAGPGIENCADPDECRDRLDELRARILERMDEDH
jgi:hypothetical protein